jgi:F-box and WD-40 domain protein CDC4
MVDCVENNWLHGGRILACFASGDDGVVTSLAMDEHHIVIAMANSHIHIFDAPTGNYRRSLIGHEAGVWALVLVSPAPRKAGGLDDPTTAASASSGRLQHRDDGLHRRASFNGTAEVFGATSNGGWVGTGGVSRPNTALGFTGPGIKKPRAVKREKQSDPAGAARGWGIKRPLVVSGGCDRVLRIWDLDSG